MTDLREMTYTGLESLDTWHGNTAATGNGTSSDFPTIQRHSKPSEKSAARSASKSGGGHSCLPALLPEILANYIGLKLVKSSDPPLQVIAPTR